MRFRRWAKSPSTFGTVTTIEGKRARPSMPPAEYAARLAALAQANAEVPEQSKARLIEDEPS